MYIAKEDRETADAFLELYAPYGYQGAVHNNLSEAKKLKAKIIVCRFCKRKRGDVKFKQNTHLISKLLGNRGYYSHDECDTCNQLFRLRENDLAHFLGTSRTFDHIQPDEVPYTFESANCQIGVKKLGFESFLVYRKKDGDEFNVDINNGTIAVNLDSKPYRPDYVYLSLLKMALGILPHDDVEEYEKAFKYLQHPEEYPDVTEMQQVRVTETAMVIGKPFALVFEKRQAISDVILPQHMFCLYVGHFMFQIMLPGHTTDITRLAEKLNFPVAPYIQLNTVDAHDGILERRYIENLRESQKQKKESSIAMGFPTDHLVGIDVGVDFIEKLLQGKAANP